MFWDYLGFNLKLVLFFNLELVVQLTLAADKRSLALVPPDAEHDDNHLFYFVSHSSRKVRLVHFTRRWIQFTRQYACTFGTPFSSPGDYNYIYVVKVFRPNSESSLVLKNIRLFKVLLKYVLNCKG